MRMTVTLVSSHLAIRIQCFLENKRKENINNDLAVVASHIPVETVHDTTALLLALTKRTQ